MATATYELRALPPLLLNLPELTFESTQRPYIPHSSATLGATLAASPSFPFSNSFPPSLRPSSLPPFPPPQFPFLPRPYIPHISPCDRLPHAPISATLGATLGD
ncbi:unnamed protein product [Closterium sp. Naga37s-1]|nr:unnamed protein product [Closterium sp. Naga37s-1]